jgi:alanine-synthesizing transaminase
MEIIPSSKASEVTYAIRNIVHKAKEVEKGGKKILYCNIGDPCKFDFAVPDHLIEAVIGAMAKGRNGYVPSQGIDEAREAVARHMASHKGFSPGACDVLITSGASEAIELCLTALLNPGENVLIPAPGYPLYEGVLRKIGAAINHYYLDERRGWHPDIEDMCSRIDGKTKGIVIINPNNPTGALYDKALLEEIIALARRKNLVLFSDEIYDKLVYEGTHISPASLCSDVPIVTFNGLSKSYLVPGWRVGWMIFSNLPASSAYRQCVSKLADARLCAPGPVQYAVKAALEGPQDHIALTLEKLRRRAEITCRRLNAIPEITCIAPRAAFYAMAVLKPGIFASDEDFVLKLLEETGVLFVHGSGFGSRQGLQSFRVVFLPQDEILEQAFDLLEEFMARCRVGRN